jgi:O-antigen/teichoic acid export membrane protein
MAAKAATLPVAALTALLGTRTVVDSLGVSGYALFALATTLPALLPLGDLGVGAAIVDAVARETEGDRELLRGAVTTGARTLMLAGGAIAAVGILPAFLHAWTPLLGHTAQPGTEAAVALAFTLFGCSLPLSLGKSLLVALGRTHVAVLLQGLGAVVTLLLLLAAAAAHARPALFVASGFLSQCAVGVASLLVVGRLADMPLLGLVLAGARPRHHRARIRHLAGPMAVISAGTAVAYSTDRLVLSHMSDSTTVALYSTGAQLFTAAAGLVGAAGLPLWTRFAHQRHSRSRGSRRDVVRLTGFFAGGGLTLALGFVLLGPTAGSWMVHDRVQPGRGLMTAFAALVFVQAVNYPASMWLTDAAGLRFQAVRVGVMAVVNLALSIPLAALLGASGPVIASVVAFTTIVLLPTLRRALSRA